MRHDCAAIADASAIEVDRTALNRHLGGELATDRSIFHAVGNNRAKALDVSAYEGAEIIHNLNEPISDG